MINRELMTSDRWIACTWPARALYSAMYAFADRDGRLPANRRVLMARTEALAVCDLRSFSRWVDELVRNGLLLDGKCMAGKEFVEFYKFKGAQSGMPYDREPTGEFPTNAAEAQPPVRSKSGTKHERAMNMSCGSEVKRSEIESEVKRSEVEAPTHTTATTESRNPVPTDLPQRLTRLWKKLHADRNLPCPKSPMFEADTIAHDRADAFAFFPTDELLLAEIRRTAACLDEKDYPVTFKGVMNQVGMSFPGTTDPEPALLVPEKHEVGLAPAIREMVTPLLKRGM